MSGVTEVSFSSYRQVQRCFLLAAAINGVLYGCFLSLASLALIRLKNMKTLSSRTFSRMAMFVLAVCLVYTVYVVCIGIQVYRIIFPEVSPLWIQLPMVLGFFFLTVATGLGDLLFIYRTWIIWGRSRLFIIPLVLFCIEMAVHLSVDVLVAVHGGVEDLSVSIVSEKLAITGMIMGLVLNFMLSAAAVGRLLLARKHLREAALPRGGNHYIKISRLLVLTTALYTATWLTLLIARRSIWSTVTMAVVFAVCCTCPLVILLHAAGRTQADTLILPEVDAGAAPPLVHLVGPTMRIQADPRASMASAERMPTFKSNEMAGSIDPRPGILWYQSDGLAEDEDIVLHCRRLSMTEDPA